MLTEQFNKYKTLVFDCDGVILNSNKIKTEAFYAAALPYGKRHSKSLVDYHVINGGVSRYVKFKYFLDEIVGCGATDEDVSNLLTSFAMEVEKGLLRCSLAKGINDLRSISKANWMIVSGGDQAELRKVFKLRGLTPMFNAGIYGSPDTKDEILREQKSSGCLREPALFIGDSQYDHVAAKGANLDFLFVSEWSEFKCWREYTDTHSIPVVNSIDGIRTLHT